MREVLSPNKPSFPATAVSETLNLVPLQSRRSCSPNALRSVLLSARFCL